MRIIVGLLVAFLAAGCSDDPLIGGVTGPTGEPSLSFSDPAPSVAPTCVSIGLEDGYRLPMLVSFEELLLRPPGACAGASQCGHLALYVMGALNNEGATPAIDLIFDKVADRYHDGSTHAVTGDPDVLSVVAEVVADDGQTLLDHDGEIVSAAVDLLTLPDCDVSPGS